MAKILVVDDEPALRALTARALQSKGHEVETAEDGLDALDRLKARGEDFDLVLSDIRMPAMDGLELANEISELKLVHKMLLMTGYAEHRERAETMRHLIYGVVDKPFTIGEIRDAVDEALAS